MPKSSLGVSLGSDAKVATVEINEDGETRHVARTCEFTPQVTAGNWVISSGNPGTESDFIDVSGAVKGILIHVVKQHTGP